MSQNTPVGQESIINSILQMEKLRHKKVECLDQSHTFSLDRARNKTQESWNLVLYFNDKTIFSLKYKINFIFYELHTYFILLNWRSVPCTFQIAIFLWFSSYSTELDEQKMWTKKPLIIYGSVVCKIIQSLLKCKKVQFPFLLK